MNKTLVNDTFQNQINQSSLHYAIVDTSTHCLPIKPVIFEKIGEDMAVRLNHFYSEFERTIFELADQQMADYQGGVWHLCIVDYKEKFAPFLFLDDNRESVKITSPNYFSDVVPMETACIALAISAANALTWKHYYEQNTVGYLFYLNVYEHLRFIAFEQLPQEQRTQLYSILD